MEDDMSQPEFIKCIADEMVEHARRYEDWETYFASRYRFLSRESFRAAALPSLADGGRRARVTVR
jgi:hypothetical protein